MKLQYKKKSRIILSYTMKFHINANLQSTRKACP